MNAHVPPPPPLEPPQNDVIPDEFNVLLTVIVVERRSRLTLQGGLARLSTVVQPGLITQPQALSAALQEASGAIQDFAKKLRRQLFGPGFGGG